MMMWKIVYQVYSIINACEFIIFSTEFFDEICVMKNECIYLLSLINCKINESCTSIHIKTECNQRLDYYFLPNKLWKNFLKPFIAQMYL